jgi:transketolase
VDTIVSAARRSRLVVSAENHSVIGGLGSAVAEALASSGVGTPLRRIGVNDTFAESGSREFLFERYGLGVSSLLTAVWDALGLRTPVPAAPPVPSAPGTYAPV